MPFPSSFVIIMVNVVNYFFFSKFKDVLYDLPMLCNLRKKKILPFYCLFLFNLLYHTTTMFPTSILLVMTQPATNFRVVGWAFAAIANWLIILIFRLFEAGNTNIETFITSILVSIIVVYYIWAHILELMGLG